MKVLQINSFFSVGGPPRIMNGIYEVLKKENIECKIAAAREKEYVIEDSFCIGTDLSVKVNALKTRIFDNEGFNAKKATKELVKWIDEYNPDIIHLHNLHGYYINIEELFVYLKKIKKPIVWTFHDCWPLTGHCPHFTMVKCNKWVNGCRNCTLTNEYPKSILIDRSKKNWNEKKRIFLDVPNLTIVCVSKWLEDIVKQSFLADYRTQVIYNGIDLTPFKPTENSKWRELLGIGNKKMLIGVAMHWLPRKGLDDYIKLSEKLDMDTVIVLVGLTREQEKDMPKNIIGVLPMSNDNDLAELYSTADVCLNLSYEETFGLTSVEALACGTPIITYDQTAVPEISNMFGMPIVKAGDIDLLAKKVNEQPKKSDSKSKLYFDLSCFEQNGQYLEYLKLYRKILEGK